MATIPIATVSKATVAIETIVIAIVAITTGAIATVNLTTITIATIIIGTVTIAAIDIATHCNIIERSPTCRRVRASGWFIRAWLSYTGLSWIFPIQKNLDYLTFC